MSRSRIALPRAPEDRAVNALALRRGRNPDAPPSLRKVTQTV